MSKAWVLEVLVVEVEEEEGEGGLRTTIWAFCFRTSAGVRMKQETSSAVEDARAWRMGVGIRGKVEAGRVGLTVWRRDLVAS